MDIERLEKLFQKYPKLENFIGAGMVTLKAARNILELDRWLMYDVYTELLDIGAVRGTGATSWRATDECLKYLEERRAVSETVQP
jgi:hypothetical protein